MAHPDLERLRQAARALGTPVPDFDGLLEGILQAAEVGEMDAAEHAWFIDNLKTLLNDFLMERFLDSMSPADRSTLARMRTMAPSQREGFMLSRMDPFIRQLPQHLHAFRRRHLDRLAAMLASQSDS